MSHSLPITYSTAVCGDNRFGFFYGDMRALASFCLDRNGYICTPNALMLEHARNHRDFANILKEASVLIPDGIGAVASLRFNGSDAVRCNGVDLGIAVARECAKRQRALYLYGGRDGRAEQAAIALRKKFPTLRIAGVSSGYGNQKEAAMKIRQSGASVVFVCLGSPLQEEFMRNYLSSDVCAFGLGGSLDIYSGACHRAPPLFRQVGCEWLYRMICEPRRLKEIPNLAKFYAHTLSDWSKSQNFSHQTHSFIVKRNKFDKNWTKHLYNF